MQSEQPQGQVCLWQLSQWVMIMYTFLSHFDLPTNQSGNTGILKVLTLQSNSWRCVFFHIVYRLHLP